MEYLGGLISNAPEVVGRVLSLIAIFSRLTFREYFRTRGLFYALAARCAIRGIGFLQMTASFFNFQNEVFQLWFKRTVQGKKWTAFCGFAMCCGFAVPLARVCTSGSLRGFSLSP